MSDFNIQDFNDQADFVGMAQRNRSNSQLREVQRSLQNLENTEQEKSWVAECIMYTSNLMDFLEQLRDEAQIETHDWPARFGSIPLATLLDTLAKNSFYFQEPNSELNIYKLTDKLSERNCLYAHFIHQAFATDVKRRCGSSLELRRNFDDLQKRIISFHDNAVPDEMLTVYLNTILSVRKGILKEGLATKLLRFIKGDSDGAEFDASEEWVDLMNELEARLTSVGLPLTKFAAGTKFESDAIDPYSIITHISGSLVDYDPKSKRFIIDRECLSGANVKYEYKSQLKPAAAVDETTLVKRFFIDHWTDKKHDPWHNFIMGWSFKELINLDIREKQEKEELEKKGDCFIATAVYGDAEHVQVKKLRRFRDKFLMQSLCGQLFVRIYYVLGPRLTWIPKKYPSVKKFLKMLLDCV